MSYAPGGALNRVPGDALPDAPDGALSRVPGDALPGALDGALSPVQGDAPDGARQDDDEQNAAPCVANDVRDVFRCAA